ncbi:MAG: hypothetical protein KGL92_11960 [Gammaproteobacteria bacterium]|nr:hypothetical protein [Gammaproteobacteria bacterium]MDE2349208.1 hypothetical protein [Gammaproteobacteria bacterium]
MRNIPWLIGFSLVSMAALAPLRVSAATRAGESNPQVSVTRGVAGHGARASATIRIHAGRKSVWAVLTSCRDAVQIVPHLRRCDVEQTAPDGSWQRIKQVVGYPWYLPRVSYVVKASYRVPERIGFEEVQGDFKVLRGSWYLRRDGSVTIAHYEFDVVPPFWIPAWVIRMELTRDLPKMLRALRARAE